MNKKVVLVREAEDRRVLRTRSALTVALVDLVMRKRYGRITIQDLLDRSGVGRATFYKHYRGKDDLLLRSFQRMLGSLDAAIDADPKGARRIAPVRELFHHIRHAWEFHRRLSHAPVIDHLYRAGVDVMAATIERRLASRGASGKSVPHQIAARAHAGALFALLRWWIDAGAPHTPEEMDAMFHAQIGT
ncbi:MAG TPA: TetR/AcrR family transcriptional regulator [Candidatus Polarisedimenticolaceae bacterium]